MARRKKIDIALLKAMRKEAQLTQKELGDRIGISRETVSAIEREVPETINSLEADILSAWYAACELGSTSKTQMQFFGHIIKYFGFSEQKMINMLKELTGSDKQD
jgi:DNA-binding XRE family transcriptional regulator